nr:winged helix-turn-helix domain-containing protein [uncultured Pseudomonas sp.]
MNRRTSAANEQVASLGPFQVYPHRRLILESKRPVRLGSRALDILLALLEHAGEVVSKEQLLARVWPDSVVEEINLRVHMAALRKALGDGQAGQRFIVTVPQRGYSLVAPLAWQDVEHDVENPAEHSRANNLPPHLTRMIGRGEMVCSLVRLLRKRRSVTLVGPGGIGKTTVALHVAELLLPHYAHGVYLLDLAPLSEPATLADKLAAVLNIPRDSDEALDDLSSFLAERSLLLLLDNCEHLIDAVAPLAEHLLKAAPCLHILATSREALRIEDECVRRLGPLECPAPADAQNRTQALRFTALQLLLERATSSLDSFELSDAELPIASELCRRLDGIPLAIEFAAAQISGLGLGGVLAQLDDGFRLLNRGRRTALPRQQTLRATLDWSHDLLSPEEQLSLRRLGVFRGRFTLESAIAVIAAADMPPEQVPLVLSQLVAKSLVQVAIADDQAHYRLLDITRTYALEKLRDAGELPACQLRQAERCATLMEQAQNEWESTARQLWLNSYVYALEDIRALLTWAFSVNAHTQIAIRLTLLSAPLWQELSLLKEHGAFVSSALAALDSQTQPNLSLKLALKLIQGNAWYHMNGGTTETIEAFTTALQLAEQCNDVTGQLRALSGLMAVNLSCGRYRQALEQTGHFSDLCPLDATQLAFSKVRLQGLAQHFVGHQPEARHHAEQVLTYFAENQARSHLTYGFGVQYDHQVATNTLLARTLWLQGFPEQAWQLANQALQLALQIDHGLSICYTLALSAWIIARYNGHSEAAGQLLELFLERSQTHNLRFFHTWARRYATLDAATLTENRTAYSGLVRDIAVTLHSCFADDAMLERAMSGDAGWATAETLRAKAVNLIELQPAEQHTAEGLLLQSLAIARQQGAIAWELRSATSLAHLWQLQGREQDAHALLAPIYARFTEGFATPDLLQAKQTLDRLNFALPA